jgi:hypothetical protein
MGREPVKTSRRDKSPQHRPGRPGEERLRAAIQRQRDRGARVSDPQPYDNDWGWWMEKRLARLETQSRWLIGLAGAALAAQVVRVALGALGLV